MVVVAAVAVYASLVVSADPREIADPARQVMLLGRDRATLQWFTAKPCESIVQYRRSEHPSATPSANPKDKDPWERSDVKLVRGPSGKRTYHVVTITGLSPGLRYAYRLQDAEAVPTLADRDWGAKVPWRREYSFSTLANGGRKTIIRLPVKVLLMPNVVDLSGMPAGAHAPEPMSGGDIERIKQEYVTAEKFLFINNHMRVWIDFQVYVDDRRQRWGEVPDGADAKYKSWPMCRSYPGKPFEGPGGGSFTLVDTKNLTKPASGPLAEKHLYVGQIEQALLRRWNSTSNAWEFVRSGGGTYGIDEWPRGMPARSQYLGGDDTAWLATHEYHHQLESIGALSLSQREDDRVIFNHFAPRKRIARQDGSFEVWPWATSFKHGEHWDGIAEFDRMLTDVQWLRLHFGETFTVIDADDDGIPDDDFRLPIDEKRFGSDPHKDRSDGKLDDMKKLLLSKWAPCAPLTATWKKQPQARTLPHPKNPDSDGDGITDDVDPCPLYPWQPFIWPMTAVVDGESDEWKDIPLAGLLASGEVKVEFRQAHDPAAYYACFRLSGPWAKLYVALDPEGKGYFTTPSTYAFEVSAPDSGAVASLKPTSGNDCPGLTWRATTNAEGVTTLELSVTNRGKSLWFWEGAGREVGAAIHLTTRTGAPLSLYEPFSFFWARMLEGRG